MPAQNGRKKDLVVVFVLLNTKRNNQLRPAESAVAAPPAIDTIADEEEDSHNEE
jgi:hypothetical protein